MFLKIRAMLRSMLKLSDDPRVRIGSVVVNSAGKVVGMGANRLPYGMKPGMISDWPRSKSLYLIHAEEDAILRALIDKSDLSNGTIYVNAYPCDDCAKVIVTVGLAKVVVVDKEELSGKWEKRQKAAEGIFSKTGVSVKEC